MHDSFTSCNTFNVSISCSPSLCAGKLQLLFSCFSSKKAQYFFLLLDFPLHWSITTIEFNVPVEYTNNNFSMCFCACAGACEREYMCLCDFYVHVSLSLFRSLVRSFVRSFVGSLTFYVLGNTKLNNFEFLPNWLSFWTNRNEKIIINIWSIRDYNPFGISAFSSLVQLTVSHSLEKNMNHNFPFTCDVFHSDINKQNSQKHANIKLTHSTNSLSVLRLWIFFSFSFSSLFFSINLLLSFCDFSLSNNKKKRNYKKIHWMCMCEKETAKKLYK